MSRSRRKTSKIGFTIAPSEKQDKRKYNRRFRRACNQVIYTNPSDLLPHLYEHSNPWSMSKEGKKWFDSQEYPKRMRK